MAAEVVMARGVMVVRVCGWMQMQRKAFAARRLLTLRDAGVEFGGERASPNQPATGGVDWEKLGPHFYK